jgi:hypothetical protein
MGNAILLGIEKARPAKAGERQYPSRAKFAVHIVGDDQYLGCDVQHVDIDGEQLGAIIAAGPLAMSLYYVEMFTRVQQFGVKTVARTVLLSFERLAGPGAYSLTDKGFKALNSPTAAGK